VPVPFSVPNSRLIASVALCAYNGAYADGTSLPFGAAEARPPDHQKKEAVFVAIHFPIPQRLSSPLQTVLQRISEVLGKTVVILSNNYQGDQDWVNFRVPGLVDEGVCIAMQLNREAVFGDQAAHYQHMTAWHHSSGTGLWLHYLRDAKSRAEYRAGPCWF
jgi:hypothetical protein